MRRVTVTPDHWTPRGEALVWGQRQSLVVWSGIPGETAEVKVVHEGQNLHFGSWQSARKPSPHRVEPACNRYHLCGGCPLMHLDMEGQHDARRQMVLDAFSEEEELGELSVGRVVPCPDGDGDFRWVVKLGVGLSDHGRMRVGAWGRRSRSIVPIPECLVAAPPLRVVMGQVAHHVIQSGLMPYDPETDRGVLRAIILRGARATGEVLVTFVVGRRVRELTDLAEAIAAASEVCGVVVHVNDNEGNAIYSRSEDGAIRYRTLLGRPYLEETLGEVTYRVGPGDFFQTNPSMATKLYADVIEGLGLEAEVPFVDLYCGVGGLALQAAKVTGWAMGVEGLEGAVLSAREAASRQNIPAEFQAGEVVDVIEDLVPRLAPSRPVVSVNPSRRGLEDGVVDALAKLQPRRLAYISCNPRSLARDLVLLRNKGFEIGPVSLYDMFPNTSHVETVVFLDGPGGDQPSRRAPRRKVLKKR